METRLPAVVLEQILRTRQLQLWADITHHYDVPKELRAKIHTWIISGRLSEKALDVHPQPKTLEPKVAAPHDNMPSSHHH